MTRFATVSSIGVPMKMMRSLRSREKTVEAILGRVQILDA